MPGTGGALWPALAGWSPSTNIPFGFHNATPRRHHRGPPLCLRQPDCQPVAHGTRRRPIWTGHASRSPPAPIWSANITGRFLTLVAFDDYLGRPPPAGARSASSSSGVHPRQTGLLSGEYDFACDLPPDQIAAVQAAPGYEGPGARRSTTPHFRLQCPEPDPSDRSSRAMTHSIDRQAIVDGLWSVRRPCRAGLQFPFYGDMFGRGLDGSGILIRNSPRTPESRPNYKGDAIPFRLLNNYYTNQTANGPRSWSEMWKQVGSMCRNPDEGKTGARSTTRRHEGRARCRPAPLQRSGLLDRRPVRPQRRGSAEEGLGKCRGNRWPQILENGKRIMRSARRHSPHARDLRARGPGSIRFLHQNGVFTGMKSSLKWRRRPPSPWTSRRQTGRAEFDPAVFRQPGRLPGIP